jgi:hypothetical protein
MMPSGKVRRILLKGSWSPDVRDSREAYYIGGQIRGQEEAQTLAKLENPPLPMLPELAFIRMKSVRRLFMSYG